jgi:hypothetical protein
MKSAKLHKNQLHFVGGIDNGERKLSQQPFSAMLLPNKRPQADDMTISIEMRAHTHHEFDATWIRNAIEEPLDEMDIQVSTQLE